MNTTEYPLTAEDTWAQQVHSLLWLGNPDDLVVDVGSECLHPLLEREIEGMDGQVTKSRIIIREEFKLLWDGIVFWANMSCNSKGMAIWGNPGVGKTLFLRYALARALLSGRPVFLCEHHSYILYFSASGVQRVPIDRTITDREIYIDLDIGARTLALFDTTPSMPVPHWIFTAEHYTPLFVVQATRGDNDEWHRWGKKLVVRLWVMMPWSEEEIRKLERITAPRPGHYTPLEIFKYLGPNPRVCVSLIPRSSNTLQDFSSQISPPAAFLEDPSEFTTQLSACAGLRAPPWLPFLQYFYIYRHPDPENTSPSQIHSFIAPSRLIIPTRFLLRSLFQPLAADQRQGVDELKCFCRSLSRSWDCLVGAMAYEALGVYLLSLDAEYMELRYPTNTVSQDEVELEEESELFPTGLPVHDPPSLVPTSTAATSAPRIAENIMYLSPADKLPSIDAIALTRAHSKSQSPADAGADDTEDKRPGIASSSPTLRLTLFQFAFLKERPVASADLEAARDLVESLSPPGFVSGSQSASESASGEEDQLGTGTGRSIDLIFVVASDEIGRELCSRSQRRLGKSATSASASVSDSTPALSLQPKLAAGPSLPGSSQLPASSPASSVPFIFRIGYTLATFLSERVERGRTAVGTPPFPPYLALTNQVHVLDDSERKGAYRSDLVHYLLGCELQEVFEFDS